MRSTRLLMLLLLCAACSTNKTAENSGGGPSGDANSGPSQPNEVGTRTDPVAAEIGGQGNNTFPTGPSLAADSSYIRYLGRIEPGAPGGVRLAWGGTGFKVRLTGASQLVVNALPNQYGENNVMGAYIDDALVGTYTVQGSDPTVQGVRFVVPVPTGDHIVSVIKRTEAGNGMVLITSLSTNGQFESIVGNDRNIEIVGDNTAAGYSSAGTPGVTTCSQPVNSVADANQQDAAATFGAVAAKSLNASWSILAASGRGVVRNFDGSTGSNMVELYPRRNPMDATSNITANINAGAVVVNLGSNDVNFWLKNQNNIVADPTGYTAGYLALLKKIRALNPSAPIIATIGPVLGNTQCVGSTAANYACSGGGTPALTMWRNITQAAVTQMADSKVTFLEFPATLNAGNNISACYLPSATGHAAMGQQLAAALATATGWAVGSGAPTQPKAQAAGAGPKALSGTFVPRPDPLKNLDPNNGITNKEFPQCHYCSPTSYNAAAVTGACSTLQGTNYACQSYCHVPDGFAELHASEPPTSGNHYAAPQLAEVFAVAQPRGRLIHSMEHGAIILSYNCPNGCDDEIGRMEALYNNYLPAGLPDPASATWATSPAWAQAAAWVIVTPDPLLTAGRFGVSSWTWAMTFDNFDQAAQTATDCFIKQHAFYGRECPNDGSSPYPRACPALLDKPMSTVGG